MKKVEITLELPHPPSMNHYWRHTRAGRVYISKEGQLFKKAVAAIADRDNPWGKFDGDELKVTIRWRRARRSGDLDNRAKVILDSLQGHVFTNDDQIVELHMYRTDDKANPGATVTVEALNCEDVS